MLRDIVCPVSAERLNKRAARLGAALTSALLVLFFFTEWWPVLAFVVLDFAIRVFTSRTAPTGWLANGLLGALRAPPILMDKAPKVFAWRLGFLMSVAAALLLPFSLAAGRYTALTLAALSGLDGVCNFCLGCLLYTYLVLPRVRPAAAGPG